MTTILAALFSLLTISFGQAAYYNEGKMEQVVYVRQHSDGVWARLPMGVPPVVGFVAVDDCTEIDSRVWLWHKDELAGPYWIVDCRAAQDIIQAKVKNIVVEIDYNTAKRWGVIGHGPSYIDVAVIRLKGRK